MGKKKISYVLIQDDKIRNVAKLQLFQYIFQITFNKRKAGLLKKAAEITMLTNIKLRITFTDLSGNLINFSSPSFEITQEFSKPSLYKNVYNFTLKDYPGFKKMKKAEMIAHKAQEKAQKILIETQNEEKIIQQKNIEEEKEKQLVQMQKPQQLQQMDNVVKKIKTNQNITIIKEEPQAFQVPRFNLQNKLPESETSVQNFKCFEIKKQDGGQKKKKGLKIDLKINIPTDRKDLKYQMDYIKYTHSRASDISQLEFTPNYSALNKTGMMSRQSNYQPQTRPTPIIDKKLMQYQQQILEEENDNQKQQQNEAQEQRQDKIPEFGAKKDEEKQQNNNNKPDQEKRQFEYPKQLPTSYQPIQPEFKQPLPSPRGAQSAFKLHLANQQKQFGYQQKLSPITGGQKYCLFSPNKQPQTLNFFNQLNSNQSPSQFLNNNSNQALLNCPPSSNPFQAQLFPFIVNNNYQFNQNVLSMSPKSASPFLQNSLDQDSLAMQYQWMQKASACQPPLTSREFSLKNSCASFGDKQNQTQFSFQENIKNSENNDVQIKKENEDNQN